MTTPAIGTAKAIIDASMRHSGKLAAGGTPTSEDYAVYMGDLNRMLNSWQTEGLKLWLQTDLSIPLVQGQGGANNPYTIGPGGNVDMTKPLRVQQGYYLDSSANRRPLFPLSWEEWMRLSTTTQEGALAQYFVDKQQTQLLVYTWLIPDAEAATGTMHLLTQQQVVNPINLNDEINFPGEWAVALAWGLADEICTGQPQIIMDRCRVRAMDYKMKLEDWDVEDAPTSFAPDQRQGGYGQSNFS